MLTFLSSAFENILKPTGLDSRLSQEIVVFKKKSSEL